MKKLRNKKTDSPTQKPFRFKQPSLPLTDLHRFFTHSFDSVE